MFKLYKIRLVLYILFEASNQFLININLIKLQYDVHFFVDVYKKKKHYYIYWLHNADIPSSSGPKGFGAKFINRSMTFIKPIYRVSLKNRDYGFIKPTGWA